MNNPLHENLTCQECGCTFEHLIGPENPDFCEDCTQSIQERKREALIEYRNAKAQEQIDIDEQMLSNHNNALNNIYNAMQ
jgi:hypothetical protein